MLWLYLKVSYKTHLYNGSVSVNSSSVRRLKFQRFLLSPSVSDADSSEGGFQLKKEHALRVLGYISSWTQRSVPLNPPQSDIRFTFTLIRIKEKRLLKHLPHLTFDQHDVTTERAAGGFWCLQLFPAALSRQYDTASSKTIRRGENCKSNCGQAGKSDGKQ